MQPPTTDVRVRRRYCMPCRTHHCFQRQMCFVGLWKRRCSDGVLATVSAPHELTDSRSTLALRRLLYGPYGLAMGRQPERVVPRQGVLPEPAPCPPVGYERRPNAAVATVGGNSRRGADACTRQKHGAELSIGYAPRKAPQGMLGLIPATPAWRIGSHIVNAARSSGRAMA